MNNTNNKRKNAVNVYRISSNKQFLSGNSLEDQKRACKAVNRRLEHAKVKEFELVETGAGEDRVEFQRVIDYCKNPKNKVDTVVIKCIDRFTSLRQPNMGRRGTSGSWGLQRVHRGSHQ